jgi:hypothetical protein
MAKAIDEERGTNNAGGATRNHARRYLEELRASRLEVVLIPAPSPMHSGHYVRAAQEANPHWYQEFCGLYESNRRDRQRWSKFKTKIKRRDTLRGLSELAAGQVRSQYAERLAEFIQRREAAQRQSRRRAA